jgi:hypothetical protein
VSMFFLASIEMTSLGGDPIAIARLFMLLMPHGTSRCVQRYL